MNVVHMESINPPTALSDLEIVSEIIADVQEQLCRQYATDYEATQDDSKAAIRAVEKLAQIVHRLLRKTEGHPAFDFQP